MFVLCVKACCSDPRDGLAVVICGLHLEDIGDDAVDLNVTNESSEEQLLCDRCTDEPQGREPQQQLGQPIAVFRVGPGDIVLQLSVRQLLEKLDL